MIGGVVVSGMERISCVMLPATRLELNLLQHSINKHIDVVCWSLSVSLSLSLCVRVCVCLWVLFVIFGWLVGRLVGCLFR